MKTRLDFTLLATYDSEDNHWPFHWVEENEGLGWLYDPRTIVEHKDVLFKEITEDCR